MIPSKLNQKKIKLENILMADINSLNVSSFDNGFNGNTKLKIERIDQNFSEYNSLLVKQAIGQGALILFLGYLILNPHSAITTNVTEMFNEVLSLISNSNAFSKDQTAQAMYASLFEGVKQIIDKIGILGLALAGQAISFITCSLKNSKRSKVINQEIENITERLYSNHKTF